MQVNAITKSGTNITVGQRSPATSATTRSIADDFVAGPRAAVLEQQFSWTLGGPIRRDRLHFFGNYEYEREPQTFSYTSPYPSFNFDQLGHAHRGQGPGVRLDFQFSTADAADVRVQQVGASDMPYDAALHRRRHHATRRRRSRPTRHSSDLGITLTQVLGASTCQRDPRRLRRLLLDPSSRTCPGRITRTRA